MNPSDVPQVNQPPEPFDPYALRSDLTDRELLAIFVEVMTNPEIAFYEILEYAVKDNFKFLTEWKRADDMAQLHVLREALRLSAQRTADAGQGGGEQ